MVHENSQKVSQNFYCIKCDYYANRKSDLQKHYKSKKHNDTNNDTLNSQFICECGKKYKFHSGYYRHKKICLYNINSTSNIEKSNIIDVKKDEKNEKDENNEMRNMIKDLIKENAKLQNQVSELIPKIGNTINKKYGSGSFGGEVSDDTNYVEGKYYIQDTGTGEKIVFKIIEGEAKEVHRII